MKGRMKVVARQKLWGVFPLAISWREEPEEVEWVFAHRVTSPVSLFSPSVKVEVEVEKEGVPLPVEKYTPPDDRETMVDPPEIWGVPMQFLPPLPLVLHYRARGEKHDFWEQRRVQEEREEWLLLLPPF